MNIRPPQNICKPAAIAESPWDRGDFEASSAPKTQEDPLNATAVAANAYSATDRPDSPAAEPSPSTRNTTPAIPAAWADIIRLPGFGPEKNSQSNVTNHAGSSDMIRAAVELGNIFSAQERTPYDTKKAIAPLWIAMAAFPAVGLPAPLNPAIRISAPPAHANLIPLAKKIGAVLIDTLMAR
jgi:hypothetical protein